MITNQYYNAIIANRKFVMRLSFIIPKGNKINDICTSDRAHRALNTMRKSQTH